MFSKTYILALFGIYFVLMITKSILRKRSEEREVHSVQEGENRATTVPVILGQSSFDKMGPDEMESILSRPRPPTSRGKHR